MWGHQVFPYWSTVALCLLFHKAVNEADWCCGEYYRMWSYFLHLALWRVVRLFRRVLMRKTRYELEQKRGFIETITLQIYTNRSVHYTHLSFGVFSIQRSYPLFNFPIWNVQSTLSCIQSDTTACFIFLLFQLFLTQCICLFQHMLTLQRKYLRYVFLWGEAILDHTQRIDLELW